MNCVIADTCTPRWVAPAMTGLARASTSAAGNSVISGASSARNAISSRTTMKSSENSCTEPCELFDYILLIHETRDRSSEVNLETGRVTGKRRADGFDQGDGIGSRAEGRQVGDHLGLFRMLVRGKPEVLHASHSGEAPDPPFDCADRLQVRRSEHAGLSRRDQGRDPVLRGLERLREILRLHRR